MGVHPEIEAVLAGKSDGCIVTGDCLQALEGLEGGCVDAVLADWPYNVGKKYDSHNDRMSPEAFLDWISQRMAAVNRVTRDSVVFFPGTKNFLQAREWLPEGLEVKDILGWHKREYAGDKWTGGPAMCWEPIVWASRAEKPFFNRIFGVWGRNFLCVNSTHGNPWAKLHPCPKPIQVMEWLIRLFVPPGGVLVDPVAGSGTTCVAAKTLGRRWIGIEIDAKYAADARRRVASTPKPLFVEEPPPQTKSLFEVSGE